MSTRKAASFAGGMAAGMVNGMAIAKHFKDVFARYHADQAAKAKLEKIDEVAAPGGASASSVPVSPLESSAEVLPVAQAGAVEEKPVVQNETSAYETAWNTPVTPEIPNTNDFAGGGQ